VPLPAFAGRDFPAVAPDRRELSSALRGGTSTATGRRRRCVAGRLRQGLPVRSDLRRALNSRLRAASDWAPPRQVPARFSDTGDCLCPSLGILTMELRIFRWAAAAAFTIALAGCGGGEVAPGSVRFALTDAPACGFDEVNLTIERIRVHRSADANENAAGWTDLRLNPARRIDLLKLRNGVLEELGQLPLPGGRYTQLRLVLAANSGSGVPAHSVVPTGGTETALTTPSGLQSGIKLIHSFSVASNQVADVLLDFDACRSVVRAGSGTYRLKPVLKVVPRTGTAISGYVDASLSGVTVTAQKSGAVLRSTTADADGRFVLAFLDPAQSPFDVVFSAGGRATAVVSGVPLTSTAGAVLSRIDAPIALPAAAARTASGTIGPTAARDTAVVRALQAVGTAAAVEVAQLNADASAGSYSLLLPTATPRVAPYTTHLPLAFVNGLNAARYTLEAKADGYAAQTQAIDLTGNPATWDVTLVRE
jgi:hypothetical protein